MQLALDDICYRIRFTDEQLTLNRRPVLAVCDHDIREIVVNRQVTDDLLPDILGEVFARICRHHQTSLPWPDEGVDANAARSMDFHIG